MCILRDHGCLTPCPKHATRSGCTGRTARIRRQLVKSLGCLRSESWRSSVLAFYSCGARSASQYTVAFSERNSPLLGIDRSHDWCNWIVSAQSHPRIMLVPKTLTDPQNATSRRDDWGNMPGRTSIASHSRTEKKEAQRASFSMVSGNRFSCR
jgi:hypothetical protein